MAIEYKLHTGKQTPWGYEISTAFTDSETKEVYEQIMLFQQVPKEAEISAMANFWIDKITMPEEPIDETMLKSDVESLLVEKGYLTSEETLEDLESKTDLLVGGK